MTVSVLLAEKISKQKLNLSVETFVDFDNKSMIKNLNIENTEG